MTHLFRWWLLLLAFKLVNAADINALLIYRLREAASKVENQALLQTVLAGKFILSDQSAILRSWFFTLAIKAHISLLFIGVLAHPDQRGDDLIEIAKLALPVERARIGLDTILLQLETESMEKLTALYTLMLNNSPTFHKIIHWMEDNVLGAQHPIQVRLLMRSVSCIIFTSLHYLLLSPRVMEAFQDLKHHHFHLHYGMIKDSAYSNWDFLNHNLNMLDQFRRPCDAAQQVSLGNLIQEAVDLQRNFFVELLGDLLLEEQIKMGLDNLSRIKDSVTLTIAGNREAHKSLCDLDYLSIAIELDKDGS